MIEGEPIHTIRTKPNKKPKDESKLLLPMHDEMRSPVKPAARHDESHASIKSSKVNPAYILAKRPQKQAQRILRSPFASPSKPENSQRSFAMAFHRSPAQSMGLDQSLSTPAMDHIGSQPSSSSSTFMSATARAARSSGSMIGAAIGFPRGARLFGSPNKKKAEFHKGAVIAKVGTGVISSKFSPSRINSATNSRHTSPIKSSPPFSKSPAKQSQSSRSPYRSQRPPAYLSAFADTDDPLQHRFTRVKKHNTS